MSDAKVAIPRDELVHQLQNLLKEKGHDPAFTWVSEDKMQLKIPIKHHAFKNKDPIDSEYLSNNNINIYHYDEGVRQVVIACQFQVEKENSSKNKTKQKDNPFARTVLYGATIYKKDKPDESYDKLAHTHTAISRLQTCPVECGKLDFYTTEQFKTKLRKILFTKGVVSKGVASKNIKQPRKRNNQNFVFNVDNTHKLTMATLEKPSSKDVAPKDVVPKDVVPKSFGPKSNIPRKVVPKKLL
jgi:hypothetical protein